MEGDSGLDVLSNDGILDIIPPSEYDPFEAKFCASLFWLVFHATEDGGLEDVPNTVTSPIQRLDKKNGFMVHPEIVEFLCKGEVYCTVCTRIYPGKVPLAGHWSVIQTLSRNGVYVVDDTDIAVTDASLEQRNPFNQGAHIALMDALMTAYSSQAVSIQSVVQAVRRFSTFSASRELPFDLEDALLLWINKTNLAVNDKYTQSTQSTNGKLLRNREQVKKTGLRLEEETVTVMFPVIDDLLKGLCDGRSLLGVLMFYEANVVNMEDICCSPKFSTEDSIRNLDVFLGLCSQYFCTSVLALKIEDILYASPSLKINIVALLAEMFLKCEGNVGSESKPGIPRSKTSCSESGDVGINGHDSCRSHSAPVSRISNVPVAGSASQCKKQKHQDRNIALKIQNYVENESIDFGTASNMTSVNKTSSTTSANITPSQMTSSDVMSPRMTSDMTSPHMSASTMKSSHLTASNVTPSDDVETCDEKNTVEVQGVVVKLRKKVPRSVEPGGGHEALLSRRMKKSLCGWSQEDISESASQTSDNEEGFDVKSDETPTVGTVHEPSVLTPDPSDLALPNELHLNLNLDLHSPDDLPVDILSPISETTEPGGSAGNSLNNSMSSTHDQREFRHQGDSEGGMDIDLCPPIAQTPRKSNNQSFAKDNSIPRGSYIISDANHTLESAFAAGIPVVERASRSSTSQSSEGPLLYGSGFVNNGIYEQSNDARELSNANSCGSSNFHDQEYPSGTITREQTRVPDQRDDKRFSTFTKSKSRDGKSKVFDSKDTEYSESTEQYGDIDKGDIHKRDIHKGLVKTSSDTKNCKKNTGPTITWSSQAKDEERSVDDGGACSESTVKKTNWGEMAAEMSESSSVIEKGSCQSDPSELSVEKRKTYDLEDLSNTLETAAAAGVPIADTLRTIADPDTDDVFTAEKPDEVAIAAPKPPPPKKKPPPKPKRTFSHASKPEIKFVSDSFVIEYYTSPPRRAQSEGSVRGGTPKSQGNYVNVCINENTLCDVNDGTSVPSSDKSEFLKDKDEMQTNNVKSPEIPYDTKPTTKVVSDLDSLLLKLAAEVQKPKHPDSSNNEPSLNSSTSNTEPELSSTKAENLSTKPDISNTKPDILNTNPDIVNTNPDILNTKPAILNTNANFSSTNRDVSSTKPDDEGYCSLSRKPGARSMKMKHESSDDLFKKEKLLTTFEKHTDMTDCKVEILRSFDNEGREIQEGVLELAPEHDTDDKTADSDSSDSPQADPVSRELNLLRLRLAEKQRDIEAQKQRTKEQQEEERKRFGQNVFWLAVGKGRERKDGVEVNSPTKKFSQSANLKPYTNDVGNDVTKMEPSNNNKFATFTKQSSLDEDLPPSMGKLQDRTYDIKYNSLSKSVPEEKQPLSNKCREDGNPALEDRKSSLEDRNSSDDVVQFRLSRQPPGTQGQSLGQIPPENSEKPKTSVLNYNSRINVPVSVPNKLIPENNQDTVNAKNSEIIADGYKQEHLNSKNEAELATSPQRKCWNTEEAINSEPCMAVSESNYDIFDQKYEKIAKSVETPESTEVIHSEIKDGLVETGNCNRVGSDSSGHGDDGDMDDLKKIPEESSGSLAAEDETPKKGLALFIGEENTVSNDDGLTPEQLRKREKFLRNRQQKIEEDKMKKEVLLEKKRRKEEKMREIQLRREQEEQDRQAKLQEKREQAELAKQERQKYEIKRKENLTKMNFNDGTLQGNYGYSRMAMNPPDRIPSGNLGYNRTGMDTQDGISGGNERHVRSNVKTPTTGGNVFEVHRPAQSTTPSAFSGFTGVQSYVKPSGKTNRKLIINAISYVCLPGTVNKETKEKCLQAMTESSAQHFLILFKEGLKFRSLYSLDLESNQVLKVFGIGPRSVTEKMIDKLFKYNSGGKDFSKIPAKGFSLSVDGFTLQKSCWQSNKPPVQSKTASNFKPSTSLYKSAR